MNVSTKAASTDALVIYFIRHGETAWSLTRRHTGISDIGLTPHGEEQARKVGISLGPIAFSTILASPRERARRTCELADLATPSTIDSDLAEWDYGDYDGRTSIEIRQQRPGWEVFRDGCPGGETPQQISGRADRLIAKVSRLGGTIALFSHGQFGCVFAARWIGLAVIEGQHFSLGPASLNILGFNADHPEIAVITRMNQAPYTRAR